jgi:hypothetical protein
MKMQEFFRTALRAVERFPDTKPANLKGRLRALERRRAKNKVARVSRRRNRT